jgi:rhodanese-related sulfurtransferase
MHPTEAYEQRDEIRFLDVREDFEFAGGHIPEALHLPLMDLPQSLDQVDVGTKWVVVCHIGQRSEMATRFLNQNGYNAENLEGGMEAWAAAGLPVTN